MGVHVNKPTDQIHAYLNKKKYGEKEEEKEYKKNQELFHQTN